MMSDSGRLKKLIILFFVFLISILFLYVFASKNAGRKTIEREWSFTHFGVSVSETTNRLESAGEGTEEDVSMSSALFKEDGTIEKKGGKFVADSPADGGSYYYTVFYPDKENFLLQADVTIKEMNPSPDGQEGFALMARDVLSPGVIESSCMSNLISVSATKLPTADVNGGKELKDTIGIRAYTGIYASEYSAKNHIQPLRYGWWKDDEGNGIRIEEGRTYRVSLEKNSFSYIATQYEINGDGSNGDIIGQYTYYIPAKDTFAKSIKSYAELDDPLTYQEEDKAYLALVVARGMNATFSNIVFKTSPWEASQWHPQPVVEIDPELKITSPSSNGSKPYKLLFKTNADGNVVIFMNGEEIDSVSVKADEISAREYELSIQDTDFLLKFTPDKDYEISAFEKLSTFDTKEYSFSVKSRNIGKDKTIYVSAAGKAENNGTSMADSVDLQTALDHADPGQTILLKSERYPIDERLFIAKGRNGTETAPITLTSVDGTFALIDLGGKTKGLELAGDYWNISRISITGSEANSHAFNISGSHNIIERVNFYNNGSTGLQIFGSAADDSSLWPSDNLILNCTSMNNADTSLEDADGFAAKLTSGEGNVFDGCIAAYNADDGWDLFAKIAYGTIGAVEIRNCIAYKNGILMVKEGSNKKEFELAEMTWDENGDDPQFVNGIEMEAGNGNGFKLGGSNMPGGHALRNSIAYENKASGITSNSCPDVNIYDCITYDNGGNNISLYTSNPYIDTSFVINDVLSYRKNSGLDKGEHIIQQGLLEDAWLGGSSHFWDPETQTSKNSKGETISDSCFKSLDTGIVPGRNEDGSVDMKGLLELTSAQTE